MKSLKTYYLLISLCLIGYLGYHYYNFQFNKDIKFVDKSKEELISYFNEICLGFEYGNSSKVTRKWKWPVKIFIVKDSTHSEQVKFIEETVMELNQLIEKENFISITKDSLKANSHLFLCSHLEVQNLPDYYKKKFKNVNENVFGNVNVTKYEDFIINAAIFINTSKPLEFQKTNIKEEITQSLGFGNDTEIYDESVFYQYKYDQNLVTLEFSEFDKKIIQLLYDDKMDVGLNRLETIPVLRELLE